MERELPWQNWQNERAYRVGRIMDRGGLVLSLAATLINLKYTNLSVVFGDLVLVFGCILSWVRTERSSTRQFSWMPIYFGYWVAISLNLWPTGGIESPFLGVFFSLLFVGGVVIQNRFSAPAVLCFTLLNLCFWAWIEAIYPLSTQSTLPWPFLALLNGVCVCAIAICIHAFVKTERELSVEISRHYQALYQTKTSLLREESANAAKNSFIANISHELRTPLAAILGFADLIRDRQTSAGEKLEHANTIWRNGEQLLRLVDDLLDLSKIEAGKIEIEKVAFKPAAVFSEVLALLGLKAEAKQLGLRIHYVKPVPESMIGDPMRTKQILLNLVSNAIKFTDRGAIDIAVAYELSPERLMISVRDTGRGMTPEESQRLFQPFSQAGVSTTRKYGGTGLGLSLSRQLARLMGGELELTFTELGYGSIFTVAIGAERAAGSRLLGQFLERLEPAVPEPSTGDEPKVLEGYRVLVVDDSTDIRNLVCKLLRSAGAEVEDASDGYGGVQLAQGGRSYDIVIMDVQMPGMDGLQATRLLRDRGFTRPILALTAHAMRADLERCLAAGYSAYLAKPFNRPGLVEKVRSCLADEPWRDSASSLGNPL